MPRLELRQTGGKTDLLLNGKDIANTVSSVEIYADGTQTPRVVLHPLIFEVDTEFDPANVQIPEQVGALLTKLGWTAPDTSEDPETPSPTRILDIPMDPEGNDAEAASIQDYLVALLAALWSQGEDFSGKRPLGSSGWRSPVEKALIRAGHVKGSFDEDGYIEDGDSAAAQSLISQAIKALGAAA